MHFKRLVVAAIVIPLLYLYIMRLPAGYFFCLMAVVSFIAQWEFYSMYRVSGLLKYAGLLSGIAILVLVVLREGPSHDRFIRLGHDGNDYQTSGYKDPFICIAQSCGAFNRHPVCARV